MTRSGAMTNVNRWAAPIANTASAIAVCGVGVWATMAALLFADARELLAFGIIAFASGLLRFRVEPGTLSTVRSASVAAPVLMASMPFLGPAASVPALLASLAQLASSDNEDDRLPRVLFFLLKYPAAAVAGGSAYLFVAKDPAGLSNPISPAAFLAAIAVFGLVDLFARLLSRSTTWGAKVSLLNYAIAGATAGIIALWMQFCPRNIMIASGAAAAALYALSMALAKNQTDVAEDVESESVPAQVDVSESERLSLVDPLTGLANDRYLYMFLQQEIGRSVRKNLPVSLLLLDIDDFQSANQNSGEEAADAALVQIGKLLKDTLREYDIVARYASDEFAIALPEAKCEHACETAERIREKIANYDFGESLKLKISVGVATYPEHGLTPDNLVSSAHHALNRAKFSGKNQVTSCNEIITKLKYGT